MFEVLKSSGLAWVCLLAGCSALVDADTSKLGGGADTDMDPVQGDDDGGSDEAPDPDYDSGCGDCDDDLACTRDSCASGDCVHEPDDGKCGEGERCQVGKGCVPERCTGDDQCNDGNPCNGDESCQPGAAGADPASGCLPGAALDCADIVPCTTDRCDPEQGCVHEAKDDACGDGVDCTVDSCDAILGCRHEASQARCDACRVGSYCDVNLDCQGGFARLCTDTDFCTIDTCSVELGMCLHEPDPNCTGDLGPDTCAEAEEIELVEGVGEVHGTLATVTSNYDTSCGQAGGRDAVYRIHVGFMAEVILDTSGSSAKTVLAVAPDECSGQGFSFGCAAALSATQASSRLVLHHYDPAEHGEDLYVLVDGATATDVGDFVLRVEVYGPSADDCEAPLYLTDCGTIVGFIDDREPQNGWGEQRGNCQSGGQGTRAPEAIVSIPGASDGSVALSVSSDDFAPTLYARTVCDSRDNDDQLGCENSFSTNGQSGSADFSISLSADERAFVLVDNGRNRGKYTLRCTP